MKYSYIEGKSENDRYRYSFKQEHNSHFTNAGITKYMLTP